MIDPQNLGIAQLAAQRIDHVAVSLLPEPFGMQRREPPVLAFGESVGRRRRKRPVRKISRWPQTSKPLRLTPSGNRDTKAGSTRAHDRWPRELLLGLPLGIQMIAERGFLIIPAWISPSQSTGPPGPIVAVRSAAARNRA